jgi:hypothetical protein
MKISLKYPNKKADFHARLELLAMCNAPQFKSRGRLTTFAVQHHHCTASYIKTIRANNSSNRRPQHMRAQWIRTPQATTESCRPTRGGRGAGAQAQPRRGAAPQASAASCCSCSVPRVCLPPWPMR